MTKFKIGDSLGIVGHVNSSHWVDYNDPLTIQND
jgi:hypothetical protein